MPRSACSVAWCSALALDGKAMCAVHAIDANYSPQQPDPVLDPVDFDDNARVTCFVCNGDGECDGDDLCECEKCGRQMRSHDCGTCDGMGTIRWKDLVRDGWKDEWIEWWDDNTRDPKHVTLPKKASHAA
jgi:RecJ-like exonuclease